MRARLSADAAEQLLAVLRYVAQDDPGAARRFHARVLDALEIAARFPESGRRLPERRDVGLREVVVAPYRILYRRDSGGILAVSVWHGARRSPFGRRAPLR